MSNKSYVDFIPGEFNLEYGGSWQHEKVRLPDDLENDKWIIDHLDFAPRTGSRTEKSVFLNTDWQITPQWQLTTGLRYANYNITDHNYSLRATNYWPNAEYDLIRGKHTYRSGHGLSRNVSLSFTPTDTVQLYGRYSDAVRLPSVFESLQGFSTGLMLDDLAPERAKTSELGANKTFENVTSANDRLRLHFAYYNNDIDNYITRSNVRYNLPTGGQIGSLGMVNLENAKMSGVELSADYGAAR